MPSELSFFDAGDAAVAAEMRADERVFVMGTNPPPRLIAEFGPERARRMPISEPLFTGMAVGAAAEGLRPVVLWRNATFSFVAFDQLANQAAKLRYMTGGQRDFPIVFRCSGGAGLRLAAQHSQSPYAIYAHLAGLKVVVPSGPADAYGLVRAAIRDDNPVVSFESSALDGVVEAAPDPEHLVPLGEAAVVREGADVTVVAVGVACRKAAVAAETLAAEGVSVELVDLRSVVPMDVETIRASVRKTGRLVVVDEAPAMCSVAAEVAAVVCEDAASLAALRAPVARVCGAHVPVPFAPELEDEVVPGPERIAEAVRAQALATV